jgi:hypothetical protein
MHRYEVGRPVRIVGAIAEYYAGTTAVVTGVHAHDSGLSHLNEYSVRLSDGREEHFYEFQLARADERSSMKSAS